MTAEEILQLVLSYPPKQKANVDFLLKEFVVRLAVVSHEMTDAGVISLCAMASHPFDRAGDELAAVRLLMRFSITCAGNDLYKASVQPDARF